MTWILATTDLDVFVIGLSVGDDAEVPFFEKGEVEVGAVVGRRAALLDHQRREEGGE